jgi:hypothetical protein
MSLIHSALDKVEKNEPKKDSAETKTTEPISKAPLTQTVEAPPRVVEHEPRMENLRFYETLNQEMEEAVEKVRKPKRAYDQKMILGIISFLLLCSLLAIRWMLPSVTQEFDAPVFTPAPIVKIDLEPGKPARAPMIPRHPISQIQFVLTGVTSSEGNLLALINDQVVAVGDKLQEGAVVKSIADKKAVLVYQGREITLNF